MSNQSSCDSFRDCFSSPPSFHDLRCCCNYDPFNDHSKQVCDNLFEREKLSVMKCQLQKWGLERLELESEIRNMKILLKKFGIKVEEGSTEDPLVVHYRDENIKLQHDLDKLQDKINDLTVKMMDQGYCGDCCSIPEHFKDKLCINRDEFATERKYLKDTIACMALKLMESEDSIVCPALEQIRSKLRNVLQDDLKADKKVSQVVEKSISTLVDLSSNCNDLKVENMRLLSQVKTMKKAMDEAGVPLNYIMPKMDRSNTGTEVLKLMERVQTCESLVAKMRINTIEKDNMITEFQKTDFKEKTRIVQSDLELNKIKPFRKASIMQIEMTKKDLERKDDNVVTFLRVKRSSSASIIKVSELDKKDDINSVAKSSSNLLPNSLNSKNAHLFSNLSNMKSDLASVNIEAQTQKVTHDFVRKEYVTLKDNVKKVHSVAEKLKINDEQNEIDVDFLRPERQNAHHGSEVWQKEYINLKRENDGLRKNLEGSKFELNVQRKKVENVKAELNQIVEQHEKEIKLIVKELQSLKIDKMDNREKIRNLENYFGIKKVDNEKVETDGNSKLPLDNIKQSLTAKMGTKSDVQIELRNLSSEKNAKVQNLDELQPVNHSELEENRKSSVVIEKEFRKQEAHLNNKELHLSHTLSSGEGLFQKDEKEVHMHKEERKVTHAKSGRVPEEDDHTAELKFVVAGGNNSTEEGNSPRGDATLKEAISSLSEYESIEQSKIRITSSIGTGKAPKEREKSKDQSELLSAGGKYSNASKQSKMPHALLTELENAPKRKILQNENTEIPTEIGTPLKAHDTTESTYLKTDTGKYDTESEKNVIPNRLRTGVIQISIERDTSNGALLTNVQKFPKRSDSRKVAEDMTISVDPTESRILNIRTDLPAGVGTSVPKDKELKTEPQLLSDEGKSSVSNTTSIILTKDVDLSLQASVVPLRVADSSIESKRLLVKDEVSAKPSGFSSDTKNNPQDQGILTKLTYFRTGKSDLRINHKELNTGNGNQKSITEGAKSNAPAEFSNEIGRLTKKSGLTNISKKMLTKVETSTEGGNLVKTSIDSTTNKGKYISRSDEFKKSNLLSTDIEKTSLGTGISTPINDVSLDQLKPSKETKVPEVPIDFPKEDGNVSPKSGTSKTDLSPEVVGISSKNIMIPTTLEDILIGIEKVLTEGRTSIIPSDLSSDMESTEREHELLNIPTNIMKEAQNSPKALNNSSTDLAKHDASTKNEKLKNLLGGLERIPAELRTAKVSEGVSQNEKNSIQKVEKYKVALDIATEGRSSVDSSILPDETGTFSAKDIIPKVSADFPVESEIPEKEVGSSIKSKSVGKASQKYQTNMKTHFTTETIDPISNDPVRIKLHDFEKETYKSLNGRKQLQGSPTFSKGTEKDLKESDLVNVSIKTITEVVTPTETEKIVDKTDDSVTEARKNATRNGQHGKSGELSTQVKITPLEKNAIQVSTYKSPNLLQHSKESERAMALISIKDGSMPEDMDGFSTEEQKNVLEGNSSIILSKVSLSVGNDLPKRSASSKYAHLTIEENGFSKDFGKPKEHSDIRSDAMKSPKEHDKSNVAPASSHGAGIPAERSISHNAPNKKLRKVEISLTTDDTIKSSISLNSNNSQRNTRREQYKKPNRSEMGAATSRLKIRTAKDPAYISSDLQKSSKEINKVSIDLSPKIESATLSTPNDKPLGSFKKEAVNYKLVINSSPASGKTSIENKVSTVLNDSSKVAKKVDLNVGTISGEPAGSLNAKRKVNTGAEILVAPDKSVTSTIKTHLRTGEAEVTKYSGTLKSLPDLKIATGNGNKVNGPSNVVTKLRTQVRKLSEDGQADVLTASSMDHEKYKSKNSKMKLEISKFKADVNKLERERDELNNKLAISNDEVRKLSLKLTNLQEHLDELKSENNKGNIKSQDIAKQGYQVKKSQTGIIKNTNKVSNINFESLKAENFKLTTQIAKLKVERDGHLREMERLKDEFSKTQNNNVKMKTERELLVKNLEKEAGQAAEAKTLNAKIFAELKKLKAESIYLTSERDFLKHEFLKTKDEVAKLKKQIGESEKYLIDLNNFKAENHKLQEEIKGVELKNIKMNDALNKMVTENRKLKDQAISKGGRPDVVNIDQSDIRRASAGTNMANVHGVLPRSSLGNERQNVHTLGISEVAGSHDIACFQRINAVKSRKIPLGIQNNRVENLITDSQYDCLNKKIAALQAQVSRKQEEAAKTAMEMREILRQERLQNNINSDVINTQRRHSLACHNTTAVCGPLLKVDNSQGVESVVSDYCRHTENKCQFTDS